ncbi:alpha/beta fold hydrolase [Allonocardiopsis opalescens]|uniref:3-oxoadipate enol-lactonase n=1 Tax=Allonocardiopsis opalescens TaxID=1144618 RepID=A0A2T0Q6P8_9ACTN|nr:alpha/beta hydrolase [Allonocardiopsis opalescens]PRX99413.1 3-oxoadipate enol-lactonase [Allonocardiopsis opalescens]
MTVLPLQYAVDGPRHAPALLLLGELGTELDVWTPQLVALRPHLRVVRVNHRGHGSSPSAPGPYTLEELGLDALGVLDRLRVDRFAAAGVGVGATIGIWLALNAPERVDGLTLVGASPNFAPAELWRRRAALVREGGTRAVSHGAMVRWFTPGYPRRHPVHVARLRRDFEAVDAESFAGCLEAVAGTDLRVGVEGIKAPTCVITGAHDPTSPPAHGRAIARAVPDARYVEVPGAAHLVTVERADAVTSLLLEQLTGNPRGRSLG